MQNAKLILNKNYRVGKIDSRIYSSFVEHMGSVIYNGIFEPGHPKADARGFRQDVLTLAKELGLAALRYPGGNFTSGYNWEDTIGPVENRPVRLDLAWKQTEPNTFGLHEFLDWSKELNTETIMTLNLGTKGSDSARNLLEYCNHPKGSFYSDLRRRNGAEQPFNIRTWCLGNELDGTWQIGHKTPKEYGRVATETARLMRYYDQSLELIAVGSSGTFMDTFPEWDRLMLMECYNDVDYIALHKYIIRGNKNIDDYLASTIDMDRQIEDVIHTADYVKAVKRSNKTLMLSFDEWNVASPDGGAPEAEWAVGPDRDKYSYHFEEVLVNAGMLLSLLRHADRIKIACQALLVNVIPFIITEKNGPAYRNGIFYPFMHASAYGKGEVMQGVMQSPTYESGEFGPVPIIDQVATYDEATGEVTIFALNKKPDTMSLEIDLADFNKIATVIDHIVMSHPLDACNSPEKPDTLGMFTKGDAMVSGGTVSCRLAGYSWNVIRIKLL